MSGRSFASKSSSTKRRSAAPKPRALPPIAIIVSRYNRAVTDALLAGAVETYVKAGGEAADLLIIDAAGSFELVALASTSLRSERVAGVVALGCIIKGETSHDIVLGTAVTQALADLAAWTCSPVGLGVLTVDSAAQAEARAGLGRKPLGNKGCEAMLAVLHTLSQLARLSGESTPALEAIAASLRPPDKTTSKSRGRA